MKTYLKKAGILLFLFFLTTTQATVFATTDTTAVVDSITFRKDNGKREVVLHKDRKIRVWTNDFQKMRGTFVSYHNDTLSFLVEGQLYQTNSRNIEKIKLYNSPLVRAVGVAFIGIGVTTYIITTIAIVNDFMDPNGDHITTEVLVIDYAGMGLLLAGRRMMGRTVNLNTNWTLVPPAKDVQD